MIIFTQQYLHNQKYQNTEIDLGYPYSVPKQSSMRNHQYTCILANLLTQCLFISPV